MYTERRKVVRGYERLPNEDEGSGFFGFQNLLGQGASANPELQTSRDVVLSPRLWDTSNQYETLPPSSQVPQYPIVEGRSRQDKAWLALFTLTVVFLLIQGISALLSANYQLPFEFEQCEERIRERSMPGGRVVQPYGKATKSENHVKNTHQFFSSQHLPKLPAVPAQKPRRSLLDTTYLAPYMARSTVLEMKDTLEGMFKGPILEDNDDNETLVSETNVVSNGNVTDETNTTKEDDGFLKRLAEPLNRVSMNETTSDVDAMLERLWSVCYQVHMMLLIQLYRRMHADFTISSCIEERMKQRHIHNHFLLHISANT
jgi:hypothetical protein